MRVPKPGTGAERPVVAQRTARAAGWPKRRPTRRCRSLGSDADRRASLPADPQAAILVLDDPSASVGADDVHGRSTSQGVQVSVQPTSRLVPVGKGLLGECQCSGHAGGTVGLLHRELAPVGTAVRQGARLDDEVAHFLIGNSPLGARLSLLPATEKPASTAVARSQSERTSRPSVSAPPRCSAAAAAKQNVVLLRNMPIVSRHIAGP